MSDMTHRVFFGDRERDFKITPKLISELERQTGVGVGALCKRLFAGDFSHADIMETIRLGLIGGGADPFDASTLVKVYASDAPLSTSYPLAVSILEALWFGRSAAPQLDADKPEQPDE